MQRVVVNGSMSRRRARSDGVPQGSIQEPVLFNILINGRDNGIECILSKFADETMLSVAVKPPEGQDAIWRHLDKLEKWTHVNLMGLTRPSAGSCTRVRTTPNINTGCRMM